MNKELRKIVIYEVFDIPSATKQQRKSKRNGNYPTKGLALANASWKALFERQKQGNPINADSIHIILRYHTDKKQLDGTHKHTIPDWDNLAKIIQDNLKDAGVIMNDGYVADGRLEKWWTSEEECVWIEIKGE